MGRHWVISAASGAELTEQTWLCVIEADPRLTSPGPVRVLNPFKPGEEMVVNPSPLSVSVVLDGETLGSLSWAEDESQAVIASCKTEETEARMRAVVKELAQRLLCEVEEA